jgi:WD40-like Beta Propeller Repeat
VRRELERIEIPGEHEARERAWELVQAAFAEREPTPRRAPLLRPLLVAAALVALLAAAFTPPGRAVIDSVRKAIGVEGAAESLFSLPDGGQLLVEAGRDAWVVSPDGGKRRLGDYREAAWSPFGRFVVAGGPNELVALEPDGDVRWKLARRDVQFPRWGGSRVDTRIAYLTRGRLHVVGGNGEGDAAARAVPPPGPVAPAWRPGTSFVLAFVDTRGAVHAYDARTHAIRWSTTAFARPVLVEWSADGSRLLVATRDRLVLFGAGGRRLSTEALPGIVDASFSPRGRRLAVVREIAGHSELLVGGRRLFTGTGTFTNVRWSPDGRWLLVAWREPDQWLFVSASGSRPRRVRAAANVRSQFDTVSFPTLSGWCC